jgi:allantoinase
MNGTIDSTLDEESERALIADALTRLSAASGVKPSGWMSIARSQSLLTADLLREAGIRYAVDWVNDELPYHFANGLINLPLNHELSDRQMITVQQQSADSWRVAMEDAFDWLAAEANVQASARILPLHVTPYIMGLPYRIAAFEQLLATLSARPEAWFAPGDVIVAAWEAQR